MPSAGARQDDAPPEANRFPKLLKPADLPDNFTRSLYKIAPYRGCGHGCRYCDGRAERYFVEGDFERDIEVRDSIPERLERELPNIRERGMIGFGSGVTDPYQPLEAEKYLSGRCADILASARKPLPVMVMTKSSLPLRDLEAWTRVNERAGFVFMVSLTSLDETIRAWMEPGAASFASRLAALRAFKAAGCVTGVLAMPLLPGLSDSIESIRSVYSECAGAGVDFIMPGGLTLRPGRQKACYVEQVKTIDISLAEQTAYLYREERLSGSPTKEATNQLFRTIARVRSEFTIPYLLPHRIYAKLLPPHDALRILLRDMDELYIERGVDTATLRESADRYDAWLISIRRTYRRKRSLPDQWLEERFQQAIEGNELQNIIGNTKLMRLINSVILEKARLNYLTLKLE